MLKKELCELEESFILTIQHLKAKIATVEGKIEEGRVSGLLCQEHLAQMYEIFKCRHDEENEVRAENFHVLQQLKRSKLQLEERIASIVKHSKEIKEMDKKIRELLEADKINKQVFERNQKELCSSMAAQKKNLSHLEEEKSQLEKLLEEAKRKQEEYVAKMTSDISIAKRRYEELRQEEAQIQILQPESADADLLLSQVSQFEVEYTQIVSKHLQEIAQSTTETESITRRNEEKQREVEEKEEILKETEAILAKEQSRHQGLETFASRLRQRKMELELLIQKVKGKTSALLQPKEEMKAELEVLRAEYIGVLDKQALELRAVEMSIYDSTMKLEQVNMENSRLRLCIRQMAEDVGRARQNKDRYWQEIHKFTEDIKALLESLQETWGEDLSLTQDYQSSDGVVLLSMSALLNHLKSRRQQLGNVSTLLHQQMLDFTHAAVKPRLASSADISTQCLFG
uniref:Coiled-coil domain containing 175 n=1 Tax=Monopterus albus TaxID=43700 RepID=A0A3Q3RCR3_MONAL